MKNQVIAMVVLLLATFSVFGQKETRSLDSFSALSVGEAIEVVITQGNKEEAIVEVDGADLEDVLTEVSADRLRIHMEDKRGGYRNVDVRVLVTYVDLDRIKVSSAADLMTDNTLKTSELEISVSSAADAKLEVEVEDLDIEVSSAADLIVKGTTISQRVKVSSSGDYDGEDLASEVARVDVSSAGKASINVTKELDADASSAGSVYYSGDPAKVYADASSGGKVRKD